MTAGRFKKGESGNPLGRKPGNGTLSKLRAGIACHVPEILKKLAQQAKAGDVAAARLLLERALPPLKPAEEAIKLDLPKGALTEQGKAVVASMASGELALAQGAAFLVSLGTLAKLLEADEMDRRIAALEAKQAAHTN